jgi:hypothetical protein
MQSAAAGIYPIVLFSFSPAADFGAHPHFYDLFEKVPAYQLFIIVSSESKRAGTGSLGIPEVVTARGLGPVLLPDFRPARAVAEPVCR